MVAPEKLMLFESKLPDWLKPRIQESGIFMPELSNTQDILFYILQQDKIPEVTKEYGYAGYQHLGNQGEDVLSLSIPEDKHAKPYMYYNALFELWSLPFLHQRNAHQLPHKDKQKHHNSNHEDDHKQTGIDYSQKHNNPILDIERKIYDQSKANGADHKGFLEARIWFLTGMMEARNNPKLSYAQQLLAAIDFIKMKK